MNQEAGKIAVRRGDQRGLTTFDWLTSRHSFSFGDYHDPRFMGFGSLRVINEDSVQPGKGFGVHGHRDMEIISYVLEGALEHNDSLGTGSIIRPGEVQRMTAGTGVRHSEFNASTFNVVHFLQIWVVPERSGLPPSYEQKAFADETKRNRWCLVGSRSGREGSVTIHQDVDMYVAALDAGVTLSYAIAADRAVWMQVIRGRVDCNGTALEVGDGIAVTVTSPLHVVSVDGAEILLFDLAE